MINQLDGLLVIPAFDEGSPLGNIFQDIRNNINATREGVKSIVLGLEELASLDDQNPEAVFTLNGLTPPTRC